MYIREIKITRPRDQRVMWQYGRKSLLNVTTLPGLVAIYIVVVEIKCFFNQSRKLTWPQVQNVVWHIELKFLIVSQHSDKFGGHRLCGSSYTAAKTFYVTLQDHAIKWSGDFMEGNSSLCIPILQKLIVLDIVLMKM